MSAIWKNKSHDSDSVWLEIYLGKLKKNLAFIRSRLKKRTGVLAVVKANAYGHGLLECALAIEKEVDYMGVSNLDEAVRLRHMGIEKPILIFGFLNPKDIPTILKHDLTLSLSDTEHAEMLNELVRAGGTEKRLKVHLKIDTGMSRLGFAHRFAADEILKVSKLKHLNLEGIFTHLAVSEKKNDAFNLKQINRFEILLGQLKEEGIEFKWCHVANSGGIFNFESSHFNLVRPGISLYGLFDEKNTELKLTPILSWKAHLRLIRRIKPGDTISYGRLATAERPMRIGVIPVGYSHGYPIALSGKSHVLIRGRVCPILGRVCMDYFLVDLGLDEKIEEGDEAVLIGESGSAKISATQLAELAGTISYEIVTRLNSTMARIYLE